VSPVRYELDVYVPEDGILHSHRHENLKSYRALNGELALNSYGTQSTYLSRDSCFRNQEVYLKLQDIIKVRGRLVCDFLTNILPAMNTKLICCCV
jgi:hypothetical protein